MNQFMTTTATVRSRADGAIPSHPLAVFEACWAAGHPDLAAGLVIERATPAEVEARLAAEGARGPSPAPVPAAPPPVQPTARAQPAPEPVSARISSAEINARHRAVLAARQSGARPAPPVAQQPAPSQAATGAIDVQAIFRRLNGRRPGAAA